MDEQNAYWLERHYRMTFAKALSKVEENESCLGNEALLARWMNTAWMDRAEEEEVR